MSTLTIPALPVVDGQFITDDLWNNAWNALLTWANGNVGTGNLSTYGLTASTHGDLSTSIAKMHSAASIDYDNDTSGLTATTLQAAADELQGNIDTLQTEVDALSGGGVILKRAVVKGGDLSVTIDANTAPNGVLVTVSVEGLSGAANYLITVDGSTMFNMTSVGTSWTWTMDASWDYLPWVSTAAHTIAVDLKDPAPTMYAYIIVYKL